MDFYHLLTVGESLCQFHYCASGPMVRSSYKAGELFVDAVLRDGKPVEEGREQVRRAASD